MAALITSGLIWPYIHTPFVIKYAEHMDGRYSSTTSAVLFTARPNTAAAAAPETVR